MRIVIILTRLPFALIAFLFNIVIIPLFSILSTTIAGLPFSFLVVAFIAVVILFWPLMWVVALISLPFSSNSEEAKENLIAISMLILPQLFRTLRDGIQGLTKQYWTEWGTSSFVLFVWEMPFIVTKQLSGLWEWFIKFE